MANAVEELKAPPELESYAELEDLRYQSFELSGGGKTAGNDRRYLRKVIFSEPVTNRSVLDIGTYLGFFCIDAMKHGAASTTGIDPNRESIRRANDLARLNSVTAEYIHADFETWDPQGQQYDIVLCFNVLHHMVDAVHSLRKIMNLARDRVILEVAQPTLWDVRRGLFDPVALLARGTSAIFLGRPKKSGHILNRSFLFTPSAMRMLFNQHTSIFEPIQIIKSPFRGRFIVSAKKRRITNLLVVAGPTSSGKSHFAHLLQTSTPIRDKLKLPPGPWQFTKSTQLATLPPGRIENLIVEYDLTLVARADMQTFAREPAFQLLTIPDRIYFVTIFPEAGHLDQQMTAKEKKRLLKKAGRSVGQALLDLYAGSTRPTQLLKAIYEDWFSFAAAQSSRTAFHTIVKNRWRSFEFGPQAEWREIYQQLYEYPPGTP